MMVMDQKQKKTNIKLVWKFLKKKKLNYNIYFFITNLLVDTVFIRISAQPRISAHFE